MRLETSDLMSWPTEILQQVNVAIDKRIGEIRIDAINREKLLKESDAQECSKGFLDLLSDGVERDRSNLDKLIQAKCAIHGAMKVQMQIR